MSKKPKHKVASSAGVVVQIRDGLINALTGLGTSSDKARYSRYVSDQVLSDAELNALYTENWIAAKAIDIPASDMTRSWREVYGLDESQLKSFREEEKRLGLHKKVNQAIKWADLYGGAAIVLMVDGTGKPNEPLFPSMVKKGALKSVVVLDRMQITTGGVTVTDPFAAGFSLPEFYNVGGTSVHHSRVIRFVGTELPRTMAAQRSYWGDSVLCRMYKSIISAQTVCDVIPNLVQNSNIDVIKIPGLMDMVADCEGEQRFLKRMKAVTLSKSVCNALIIDAQESFEKSSASLAGIKELVYDFLSIAAGAADIPLTRFLSTSPGGLNATGDADLRNYYDRIKANQESKLSPALEQLDAVMLPSLFGGVPEAYAFEFPSLWQIPAKEQAEIEEIRSRRDTAYVALGVPDSAVLKTVQEEGTYAIDDTLISDLKELESAGPIVVSEPDGE